MPRERLLIIFLIILSGLLAASAVNPYDRATWFMEVAPVLIVMPILVRVTSFLAICFAMLGLTREQDRQIDNLRVTESRWRYINGSSSN